MCTHDRKYRKLRFFSLLQNLRFLPYLGGRGLIRFIYFSYFIANWYLKQWHCKANTWQACGWCSNVTDKRWEFKRWIVICSKLVAQMCKCNFTFLTKWPDSATGQQVSVIKMAQKKPRYYLKVIDMPTALLSIRNRCTVKYSCMREDSLLTFGPLIQYTLMIVRASIKKLKLNFKSFAHIPIIHSSSWSLQFSFVTVCCWRAEWCWWVNSVSSKARQVEWLSTPIYQLVHWIERLLVLWRHLGLEYWWNRVETDAEGKDIDLEIRRGWSPRFSQSTTISC